MKTLLSVTASMRHQRENNCFGVRRLVGAWLCRAAQSGRRRQSASKVAHPKTAVAILFALHTSLAALDAGDLDAGASWPCWRGPDGSGCATPSGKTLVDDLADMKLVWRSEERGIPANCWHNETQGGYDSPVVANGKVFISYFKGTGDILDTSIKGKGISGDKLRQCQAVVTEDIVLCVDAATGKTLWKKVLGEGINLYQRRKSGPHQGVCWSAGKVYAQSTLGRVFCLKETDGSVIWQADIVATPKQLKVLEAYKKAGKQHPYRGVEPPEFKECGAPRLFMFPLCVADGVVIGDSLALNAATGQPAAWTKPPGGSGGRDSTAPLRWVCDGQEFVIIGNVCYRPKTGQVVWSIKEASDVTPAIKGNYLVARGFGKDGGYVGCKIDSQGYSVLWTNKDYSAAGAMASTGVIHDGWFYAEVHTAGGRAKMPAKVTELAIGIELATGKVVGPVAFEGVSQTLCTSPVGMDGRWFFHVGAGYSGMVMMKMDPKDFRQVGLRMPTVKSHLPLPGGSKTQEKLDYCLTSTPALAAGRMYFRGSDSLYCFDLQKR